MLGQADQHGVPVPFERGLGQVRGDRGQALDLGGVGVVVQFDQRGAGLHGPVLVGVGLLGSGQLSDEMRIIQISG